MARHAQGKPPQASYRSGEKLYLIHMIDDSTNALLARFVCSDSTPENMRRLWTYLKRNGRPGAFYTDKASLFRTAPKGKRDERNLPRDEREPLPPTQIGRAAGLGIVRRSKRRRGTARTPTVHLVRTHCTRGPKHRKRGLTRTLSK